MAELGPDLFPEEEAEPTNTDLAAGEDAVRVSGHENRDSDLSARSWPLDPGSIRTWPAAHLASLHTRGAVGRRESRCGGRYGSSACKLSE